MSSSSNAISNKKKKGLGATRIEHQTEEPVVVSTAEQTTAPRSGRSLQEGKHHHDQKTPPAHCHPKGKGEEEGGPTEAEGRDGYDEEEEEEPLEIVDYSCVTPFEEDMLAVERFLRECSGAIVEASRSADANSDKKKKRCCGTYSIELERQDMDRPLTVTYFYRANKPAPSNHQQDVHEAVGEEDAAADLAPQHLIEEIFREENFLLVEHGYAQYSSSDSADLLSCLCCAVERCELDLPCFVPSGDTYRKTFVGRRHSGELCTRYTMQATPTCPPQCSSLSGLFDLFHLNVGLQSRVPRTERVLVDYKAEYISNANERFEWQELLADENEQLTLALSSSVLSPIAMSHLSSEGAREPPLMFSPDLEFGTHDDPISLYHVFVEWTAVDETDVVDTTVRTTFDPHKNPSVVGLSLDSRSVLEYSKKAGDSIDDVIRLVLTLLVRGESSTVWQDDTANPGSPSSTGPEKSPSAEEGGNTDGTDRGELPQTVTQLAKMIIYGNSNSSRHSSGSSTQEGSPTTMVPPFCTNEARQTGIDDLLANYPPGSVFSRFAYWCCQERCAMLRSILRARRARRTKKEAAAHYYSLTSDVSSENLTSLDELSVLKEVWQAVVDELQYLVDHDTLNDFHWLPLLGVPVGVKPPEKKAEEGEATPSTSMNQQFVAVDQASCLVHQKLQLIYACGQSLQWQQQQSNQESSSSARKSAPVGTGTSQSRVKTGWEEDDDLEVEDDDEDEDDGLVERLSNQESSDSSSEEEKGEERKEKSSGKGSAALSCSPLTPLMLLRGVPMKIPQERPPIPICSDQFESQEAELTALGTSSHARITRAWLQRELLAADMAAFKQANRLCGAAGSRREDPEEESMATFADFVHWHSPSDFVATPAEEVSATTTTAAASEKGKEKCVPLSSPESVQDNEQLGHVSARMKEEGNMWLALWRQTKPEAGRLGFNAAGDLHLALRWLRDTAPSWDSFPLLVIHYHFSNALHRMQSHRLHKRLAPLQKNFMKVNRSLGNGLASIEQLVEQDAVPLGNRDDLWDIYRTKRKQLESQEVLLCAAISLECKLLRPHFEPAGEFIVAQMLQHFSEVVGGSSEVSRTVTIPLPLWKEYIGVEVLPPAEGTKNFASSGTGGGDGDGAKDDDDSTGRSGAAARTGNALPLPLLRSYYIRANVERPMNCPPSPQLLYASRDSHDVLRVGLALSEALL